MKAAQNNLIFEEPGFPLLVLNSNLTFNLFSFNLVLFFDPVYYPTLLNI